MLSRPYLAVNFTSGTATERKKKTARQSTPDVVVHVALGIEPLRHVPRIECALVARADEVGPLHVGRKTPIVDRGQVVEPQRAEIKRPDREQGEVVLRACVQLGITPELLAEIAPKVVSTRRGLPPQRQIFTEGPPKRVNEVVPPKYPDAVLPIDVRAPKGEIAPERRAAVVERAPQRRSHHHRVLARAPIERHAGARHAHGSAPDTRGRVRIRRKLGPHPSVHRVGLIEEFRFVVVDLVQPPGNLCLDPSEPRDPQRRFDSIRNEMRLPPRGNGISVVRVDVVLGNVLTLEDAFQFPVDPRSEQRGIPIGEHRPGIDRSQTTADHHLFAPPEQIAMHEQQPYGLVVG